MNPSTRWPAVAEALPGLVALAVFVAWANESGGYFPTAWYAGGLLLAALLFVLVIAWPALLARLGRPSALALAALTAFTAWSYLSIWWAEVPGDAWDGANRAALYLVAFALFALWPWSAFAKVLLLGAFALAVSLLGLWSLLAASRADDPGPWYAAGRFIAPVLYSNGNAGLYLLAFWPALLLASRRELPVLARPFLLAAAGVLLELAVLPQSRGAAVAFLCVLLAYFLVFPGRLRSLVFFAPVALTLAAALPRLLDSSKGTEGAALAAGADLAGETVAVSALVLLLAGAVAVTLDQKVKLPEAMVRRVGRVLAVVAAVGALAALVAAALVLHPVARAESAWKQFSGGEQAADPNQARLLRGFDTNRPDVWRVAFDEFREHPLLGIGSDNFTVAYTRERRSEEETLYSHSLVLEVLAQTGVVGSAFFVLFVAGALAAAFVARSRTRGIEGHASAIGIVMFAYWLAHASIDWFWQLPALTAPAFAFLALAGTRALPAGARPATRRLPLLATAAIVAAVCVSFVFPWFSARQAQFAASAWRVDAAAAATALDRARRLNPLTDQVDLVAGSIARRQRDWHAMALAYERALERNPHSWYSRLQLALAWSKLGRRGAAISELVVAERLNPREPLVDLVRGWIRRGEPVNVTKVAEVLLNRHAGVTGTERPDEPTRKP